MSSALELTFQPPPEAEAFYIQGLRALADGKIPCLRSGTYAEHGRPFALIEV